MDWDAAYYVRLFRTQSPDWLALSPLARGLFAELMLLADKAGRIPLGKQGLRSVAVPLRGSWEELERHVLALIEDGCLVHADGALVIRNFEAAQGRAKTSTERSRDHRDRVRSEGQAPSPAPGEGKGRGQRRPQRAPEPVAPPVAETNGDEMQRDATDGDERDGCNDTNKQTDKQTTDLPLPPRGGERAGDASPEEPTDHQLWQKFTAGVSNGLAALARFVRTADDTQALHVIWGEFGVDKGVSLADFLPQLERNATAYVQDAQQAGQDPALEQFYRPIKFLTWLRRHEAGSPPFPFQGARPTARRGAEPLAKVTGATRPPEREGPPPPALRAMMAGIGKGPRP